MPCLASIQEMKWKPRSLPREEEPRQRSGPIAIKAATRMMAGPVQRFGRGKTFEVVFDCLPVRDLLMIGPPSMCDAGVRKSHAEGVRASSAELRITRSMLMECPAFIVTLEKRKPLRASHFSTCDASSMQRAVPRSYRMNLKRTSCNTVL